MGYAFSGLGGAGGPAPGGAGGAAGVPAAWVRGRVAVHGGRDAGPAALGRGHLRDPQRSASAGPGGRPPAVLPRGTTPGTPGPRSPLRAERRPAAAAGGWRWTANPQLGGSLGGA